MFGRGKSEEPPAGFLGRLRTSLKRKLKRFPQWLVLPVTAFILAVLLLTRPTKPYNHISTTLPLPLLTLVSFSFESFNSCGPNERVVENDWPLPELISEARWKPARDSFKGWAPGGMNPMIRAYRGRIPDWLPVPIPPAFARWNSTVPAEETLSVLDAPNGTTVDGNGTSLACGPILTRQADYSPVDDPLRITNLDSDPVEPLRAALANKNATIKHVVMIQMESMREELFPLQQGSLWHKMILESHPEEDRDEINSRLSKLTPNSERITGKAGGFTNSTGHSYVREEEEPSWATSIAEGFGGLNVVGAFTGSSVSTKSVVGSHCVSIPEEFNPVLDDPDIWKQTKVLTGYLCRVFGPWLSMVLKNRRARFTSPVSHIYSTCCPARKSTTPNWTKMTCEIGRGIISTSK